MFACAGCWFTPQRGHRHLFACLFFVACILIKLILLTVFSMETRSRIFTLECSQRLRQWCEYVYIRITVWGFAVSIPNEQKQLPCLISIVNTWDLRPKTCKFLWCMIGIVIRYHQSFIQILAFRTHSSWMPKFGWNLVWPDTLFLQTTVQQQDWGPPRRGFPKYHRRFVSSPLIWNGHLCLTK